MTIHLNNKAMNTKPIYVVLSLVAVAAVAASLEITPRQPPSHSASKARIISLDSHMDLGEITDQLQMLKQDFRLFYDKLFKLYRASSGQNLKVLGEALSYAVEIDTTLDQIAPLLILNEMAQNPREASLIVQNWIDKTKASMDMHLYFIHRMENDSAINSETAQIMVELNQHIDRYQAFLSEFNKSLVAASIVSSEAHLSAQSPKAR